jgi:hypothetical protein
MSEKEDKDVVDFHRSRKLCSKLFERMKAEGIDASAGVSGVLTKVFEMVIQGASDEKAALEIISACMTYALPEDFGKPEDSDDDEYEIHVELDIPEGNQIN